MIKKNKCDQISQWSKSRIKQITDISGHEQRAHKCEKKNAQRSKITEHGKHRTQNVCKWNTRKWLKKIEIT